MPTRPGTQTAPSRGVPTSGRTQPQFDGRVFGDSPIQTTQAQPSQPSPTPTPSPFTAPSFYDTGAGKAGVQHGGAAFDRSGGFGVSLEQLNQALAAHGITASWSPTGLQLTGPNGQVYNNVGGSHEGAGPGGQSAFLAQALGIQPGPNYYGQVAALDQMIAGVAQRGHYARSLGLQPDATTQDIQNRNQTARAQGVSAQTMAGASPAAMAWMGQHGMLPTAGPNDPPAPPPTPTPDPPPLPPTGPRPGFGGGAMPPVVGGDPFSVPSPGAVPVNSAPSPAAAPAAAAASPAHPAPAAVAPVPSPFGVTPRPLQPAQALTTTAGASGVGARPATPAPAQPFRMSRPPAPTQQFGMDAQRAAGTRPPSPLPAYGRPRSPFDVPGMR